MNKMFAAQNEPIKRGIESLRDAGFIKKAAEEDFTDSLIAVDGGNIVEKMSGADIFARGRGRRRRADEAESARLGRKIATNTASGRRFCLTKRRPCVFARA